MRWERGRVSQTEPPYIHRITPSITATWSRPRSSRLSASTAVSCLRVKTKTSSSVEARISSSGAVARDSPTERA